MMLQHVLYLEFGKYIIDSSRVVWRRAWSRLLAFIVHGDNRASSHWRRALLYSNARTLALQGVMDTGQAAGLRPGNCLWIVRQSHACIQALSRTIASRLAPCIDLLRTEIKIREMRASATKRRGGKATSGDFGSPTVGLYRKLCCSAPGRRALHMYLHSMSKISPFK